MHKRLHIYQGSSGHSAPSDVRHGTSTGIQCSSMSLDAVSWTLFRYPGLCDKFDLGCILGILGQLFKLLGQFRYLEAEDLPKELLIGNSAVNVEFLRELGMGNYKWGIFAFYC